MYQPVGEALWIEWWAKLSYLEGKTLQVITHINYKMANALTEHESITVGLGSRCLTSEPLCPVF